MKKKMILSCLASVVIATVVCFKSFQTNAYDCDNLLLQNVEALTQNSGDVGGAIKDYKNALNQYSIKETKVETQFDSTGTKISVNYDRSCLILKTYCKSSRKKTCYPELNKTEIICKDWVEVK